MKNVIIYTDGSCLGNPGPGGWAAILTYEGHEKMISGGKERTTNNHMELTAVIKALQCLKVTCNVKIVTDSKYVTDAFNKGWVHNWKKANNFAGRPNEELWRIMYDLSNKHNLTFEWIKGHNGHPYNERCDEAAQYQANLYKELSTDY
jgi:ribonuclease HI